MTVHDFSKNEQSTTPPPNPSETKINPSRPLPPEVKERFSLKFPVLRLRSLPPSVVKSAGHDQIHSLSMLPKLSPKARFQQPAETEDKKSTNKNVQECHQTVAPVEQEDNRRIRPEEEKEDSIKWTVLKNCPTDPHYLLRPQNPAECLAVNTLSGLTCGVPQKGLSQNKHKIRVDFKVCFSVYQLVCLDLYKFEGIQFSTLLRAGFLVNASKESSHPFFPCVCQEDCAVQNVWLMGGLSVLTSVSTTPQPVCLLCASKGRHEVNDA